MDITHRTKTARQTARTPQVKAAISVRPAVEAALLAALAFGAAQVGWATLAPNTASATGSGEAGARADAARLARLDVAEPGPVASPFAADAAVPLAGEGATAALEALLAGFTVSGVRVSTVAERSSAIFAAPDGNQKVFRVGEELAAGLRLGEVNGDHVIIQFAGGVRRLDLARPPVSFARALMGDADARATIAPIPTAAAPTPASPPLTPADMTPFVALSSEGATQ